MCLSDIFITLGQALYLSGTGLHVFTTEPVLNTGGFIAFIPNFKIKGIQSSFLSLPVKELEIYLQDRGIIVGD